MSQQLSDRPIRLMIVDDHTLFREGLVRLLSTEGDFQIVASCRNIEEALGLLAQTNPDVVLLDYYFSHDSAQRFLVRAPELGFKGRVLILSAGMPEAEAASILSYGAAGIVLKHHSSDILAKAIRLIHQGEVWLDQEHLRALINQLGASGSSLPAPKLSEREKQVLRGVCEGLTNKEIAALLQVSESSVKAALQQLFSKTGTRSRTQLLRLAMTHYRNYL